MGELDTDLCVWCQTGPTVFYAESPCVSDNCATISSGPSATATPIVYLTRRPTTGATGWTIELLAQCNGGANGPFFDLFFLSTNILTSMNNCTTGGLVGLNTYTPGTCGNSFSCLDEFCGLNSGNFPSYIMGHSGSVTITPGSCP